MRTVFDIEGNGLYLDCTKLWCICIKHNDKAVISFDLDNLEGALEELDKADELVGHNILNYDLPILKKFFNWEPRKNVNRIDTLVKSRLLNPDRRKPASYTGKGGPHSLEAWGYRVGRGKITINEWSVYDPAILRRCIEDVEINYLTDLSLSTEEIGHNWDEALELEYRFAELITVQEHNGINIDQPKIAGLLDQFGTRIDEIDEDLIPKLPYEIIRKGEAKKPFTNKGPLTVAVQKWYEDAKQVVCGPFNKIEIKPFNLNSITKVKEYLLEHGWEPTTYNYSKKTQERTSPKLTEDSFDSIDGEMPRLVKERILLNHRRSTVQGWVGRLRRDGRLTAGVNTCGTNTGRVRHSGVANIPRVTTEFGREMREIFIPSEGWVLVGHDASQIELRLLAHYMNDAEYIEAVLGGDIHTYNMEMAGLTVRDDAKTFIYALNYGAKDKKLGTIVGGTEADGKALRKKFYDEVPAMADLVKKVKRSCKKGWLRGLDNRRLYMRGNSWKDIDESKSLNTLLQGAGAVAWKKSGVILDMSVDHTKCRKVVDYHDEAQWEVLPEYVETYRELAKQSLVKAGEYYKLNIALDADSKSGRNWSETH